MTDEQLLELARLSLDGEIHRHSIDQFCQTYPDITEEEAYRGQELRLKLMEQQGHHVVGYKLGGNQLSQGKPTEKHHIFQLPGGDSCFLCHLRP